MGDKEGMCPICFKNFPQDQLQAHVNKCIFLNTVETEQIKKRRSTSPAIGNPSKSPKINKQPHLFQPTVSKPSNGKTSTKQQQQQEDEVVILEDEFKPVPISFKTPLAIQLQPKTLNDFFGQTRVLGETTVLRQLLERGEIQNMILWGPPGCGKTSLSSVIRCICQQNPKKLRFTSLCAANCGVKDVSNIVSDAKLQQKFGKKTVLFMDEIHRFNKKQQDIFLLHVEKGDIILIGATTENPSFSLNNALLSRCRVIVMEKLEPECLYGILDRGVKRFGIEVAEDKADYCEDKHKNSIVIEKDALLWIADTSDGDARIALSNLELLLQQSKDKKGLITVQDIKDGIKKSHLLYDRKGEEHYNTISAMHKSIRGSDPDASLYWTTRMIVSGEDPLYIARRMVRAASEDIGNADPNALQLAIATMQGCQLLGKPECDCLLAQCAIYLARAPKSREADTALAEAKRVIMQCEGLQPAVPMHIRNAPTKLMKELGYGKLAPGQRSSFMPEGLEDVSFFH